MYQKAKRPRKANDELLKGIFKENFTDFLHFLYPEAEEIFDLAKGIEFMDKELLAITPDRERTTGKRIADLLAKVYLRDGTEKWILVHTEIEGGSKKEFARRMFQYHYRLLDRYLVPVETIVVFTGDRNQARPSQYQYEVIDTLLKFKYRAYHIFDHNEFELLERDNIFALIVLACQKSLDEGRVSDSELGENRLLIARALLGHEIDHDRIMGLLVFIKNFLFVDNEGINCKFDEEIAQLSENTIDMGVIDIVKKQEREQGRMEERAKAEAEKLELTRKAKTEKLEIARKAKTEKLEMAREMKKEGLPMEQIAKFTKLSMAEIERL